ncbi:MAG: glycoside hydrolase family 2 TIM barrel-domain containing protein [Bacteroides graminisolvens]
MIRQHYNHPSIITWGFMNEILLVTQREYKNKEELKPVIKRTIRLAKQLERILKEEDSFRSSIMAFHASNMYNEIGLSDVTDVVGWNLYSGWYGGKLSDFEKFLDEQHTKYPNRPIIVSEYGAGSDKRLHSFTPRHFDFSIEYQQQYLEHYLPVIEKDHS